MPHDVHSADCIVYLQRFLTHNKARGMVAELSLKQDLALLGTPSEQKLLSGGWLISPKLPNPQHYRYMVSVLPTLYSRQDELTAVIESLEQDRGWQALATHLAQSSIGIIVSGGISDSLIPDLGNLQWMNFIYRDEHLVPAPADEPFAGWPGNRGRASKGTSWQLDVINRFELADTNDLIELVMRQAFFYGYLKQRLQKPLEDPYDVDAFVVSFTGRVLPVEIKEKSPTDKGDFGIDAGRILMLLRLCLITDSNAVYLIRQVDNSAERNLMGWKYITLSDMIMGCKWNLQAGGTGMGGGATQTVMISGAMFQDFGVANLSEEWLNANSSLQTAARMAAKALALDLGRYLQP